MKKQKLKGYQKARKKLMEGIREVRKVGLDLSTKAKELLNSYNTTGQWTRKVNQFFKKQGRHALAEVAGDELTYNEWLDLRKALRARQKLTNEKLKKQMKGVKIEKVTNKISKYDIERIKDFKKAGKRGIRELIKDIILKTSKEYQNKRNEQWYKYVINKFDAILGDQYRGLVFGLIKEIGKGNFINYMEANPDIIESITEISPPRNAMGGVIDNGKLYIDKDSIAFNYLQELIDDLTEMAGIEIDVVEKASYEDLI